MLSSPPLPSLLNTLTEASADDIRTDTRTANGKAVATTVPAGPITGREGSSDVAKFVRLFTDIDTGERLHANRHIPAMAAMYAFVRDKLAFRLTDAAQARSLLMETAIETLLLTGDKLTGRRVFTAFLSAWEALRRQFGTFDICNRENRAARQIPELTKANVCVGHLVELGKILATFTHRTIHYRAR
jgi:hypothetical protein